MESLQTQRRTEKEKSSQRVRVVRMTHEDKILSSVLQLQEHSYPETLHEERTVFQAMLQSFSKGCFALEVDGALAGYAFCFPARRRAPKKLNTSHVYTPSGQEDCLYLHDLVVHEKFRGRGFAEKLLAQVEQLAKELSFNWLCLTAVMGADTFWSKKGFHTLFKLHYSSADSFDSYMEKALFPVLQN
eukprot:TRINITY_DN3754_c0_g1_i1.p1 TRINITY_DN3754_c0_g1~~TRINITY_DN3754_c0_g1_i1.p1  ORF type:complete len:187 (-),score=31.29 TRINITY_DN3754_c0_g1_i1:128-688(-)